MHRTSCDIPMLPATVLSAYGCSRFWILVSDQFLILSFSLTSLHQSCSNAAIITEGQLLHAV